jgi:hypothetical protein
MYHIILNFQIINYVFDFLTKKCIFCKKIKERFYILTDGIGLAGKRIFNSCVGENITDRQPVIHISDIYLIHVPNPSQDFDVRSQ